MGEITISTKEYKELIEAQIRIAVFRTMSEPANSGLTEKTVPGF